MSKQKRDNAYYIQRLKKDRPDLHADILAEKISVNEARKLAGLGGSRTRLNELKNAWAKATPKEQSDFLSWAGLSPSKPMVAPASASAFAPDSKLQHWACRRIPEIMDRRGIKAGTLSEELGLPKSDQSVMTAVRRGTRIKSAAAVAAIERWLSKYSTL